MAKELIEITVGKGQKLKAIFTEPSVMTAEPLRSTTKTIGAAIMQSRLSQKQKQIESQIDVDPEQFFNGTLLSLDTAYRQWQACKQSPGSEETAAEIEYQNCDTQFRKAIRGFLGPDLNYEQLEEKIDLSTKEFNVGESHMGQLTMISKDVAAIAKGILLDVCTEPEVT